MPRYSDSRAQRGSSSSSSYYPTQWSKWEWDEPKQCNRRYRLIAPGKYEIEHDDSSLSAETPRTGTSVTATTSDAPYSSNDHYTTASESYSTSNSSYTNQATASAAEDSLTSQLARTTLEHTDPTHIAKSDIDSTVELFDRNYRVHYESEFTWGRVFKILWVEPKGSTRGNVSQGTDGTVLREEDRFGQEYFAKVRRFVIVHQLRGHCICLPINTYSKQGSNKRGLHREHHAVIYTSSRPVMFEDERLDRSPIKMKPENSRHKLDKASRLNYAKLYTVEYNVKVWFVGRIDPSSEQTLVADYNLIHPPMSRNFSSATPQYGSSATGQAGAGSSSYSTQITPSTTSSYVQGAGAGVYPATSGAAPYAPSSNSFYPAAGSTNFSQGASGYTQTPTSNQYAGQDRSASIAYAKNYNTEGYGTSGSNYHPQGQTHGSYQGGGTASGYNQGGYSVISGTNYASGGSSGNTYGSAGSSGYNDGGSKGYYQDSTGYYGSRDSGSSSQTITPTGGGARQTSSQGQSSYSGSTAQSYGSSRHTEQASSSRSHISRGKSTYRDEEYSDYSEGEGQTSSYRRNRPRGGHK